MIKKIMFFIFLMMFVGTVSAWEYDSSYSYGDSSAYAKVVGNYPTCSGQKYGSYCVGNYYVDVSYVGDKFYMGYSYLSWSPTSNDNGYSGIPSASSGKKTLPIKDGSPKGYIICAWDYDSASNGDWSWTSQCGGYLVDTFSELKVVECYENSDCGSNEFCDKDGNWKDWGCVFKICNEGEERCFGTNLQKCERNKWVEKGKLLNKCGVECLEDSHCPADEISDKFCSGNNIMETRTDNSCFTNYKCVSSTQDIILETCSFKCEEIEGEGVICIEKICDEGKLMCSDEENVLICQNNQWELKEKCPYGCEEGKCKSFYTTIIFYTILGVIVFVVSLILILVLFVFKRKQRRK